MASSQTHTPAISAICFLCHSRCRMSLQWCLQPSCGASSDCTKELPLIKTINAILIQRLNFRANRLYLLHKQYMLDIRRCVHVYMFFFLSLQEINQSEFLLKQIIRVDCIPFAEEKKYLSFIYTIIKYCKLFTENETMIN